MSAIALSLPHLPPELLRHVLLHLDLPALFSLSQTCLLLSSAITDDQTLWRLLAQRRFRVSARVARSRRLLSAGPVCWRLLYHQWHNARRMPASKLTGTQHPAFARGALHVPPCPNVALAWVTVASTDDCRLVAGKIILRVILQNLAAPPMLTLHLKHASFSLTDKETIPIRTHTATTHREQLPDYSASVRHLALSRLGTSDLIPVNPDAPIALAKDDFAVCTLAVKMPKATFEIDALERLACLSIPVACGQYTARLIASFREKVIWENYERLPGGWWVRAQASTALA